MENARDMAYDRKQSGAPWILRATAAAWRPSRAKYSRRSTAPGGAAPALDCALLQVFHDTFTDRIAVKLAVNLVSARLLGEGGTIGKHGAVVWSSVNGCESVGHDGYAGARVNVRSCIKSTIIEDLAATIPGSSGVVDGMDVAATDRQMCIDTLHCWKLIHLTADCCDLCLACLRGRGLQ